jgi:hypothetical protein
MLRGYNLPTTHQQKKYIRDGIEVDESFMEIGHLIGLIIKGNCNAIWSVCSPIVHKHHHYLDELENIVRKNPTRESYHSIKGMANSQYYDAVKRVDVRDPQKSLKTAYRTINFGIHLLYRGVFEFTPIEGYISNEDVIEHMARLDEAYNDSKLYDVEDWEYRDFLEKIRLHEYVENIMG